MGSDDDDSDDDEESAEDNEETTEFWTEGSEYLGRIVVRRYEEGGAPRSAFARVVSWLPKEESDFFDDDGAAAALYKIEYYEPADFGLEDLEEWEVRQGLASERDAKKLMEAQRAADASRPRRSGRTKAAQPPPPRGRRGRNVVIEEDDDSLMDEEEVVPSSTRSTGGSSATAKKNLNNKSKKKKVTVVEVDQEPLLVPEEEVVIPPEVRSRSTRVAAVKAISRGFNGAEEPELAAKRRAARVDLALKATTEVAADFGALWLNRKDIAKRARLLVDEDDDLIGEVTVAKLDEWLKVLVAKGQLAAKNKDWFALTTGESNDRLLAMARVYDAAASKKTKVEKDEDDQNKDDGPWYASWRPPRRKAVIVAPPPTEEASSPPQQPGGGGGVVDKATTTKGASDDDDDDPAALAAKEEEAPSQKKKRRRTEEEEERLRRRVDDVAKEAARSAVDKGAAPRKPRTLRQIHREEANATLGSGGTNNDPALGWHHSLKKRLTDPSKSDSYYYPPTDDVKHLRSLPDVKAFLKARPDLAEAVDATTGKEKVLSEDDFVFGQRGYSQAEYDAHPPLDRAAVDRAVQDLWDSASGDDQRRLKDQEDQEKTEYRATLARLAKTAKNAVLDALRDTFSVVDDFGEQWRGTGVSEEPPPVESSSSEEPPVEASEEPSEEPSSSSKKTKKKTKKQQPKSSKKRNGGSAEAPAPRRATRSSSRAPPSPVPKSKKKKTALVEDDAAAAEEEEEEDREEEELRPEEVSKRDVVVAAVAKTMSYARVAWKCDLEWREVLEEEDVAGIRDPDGLKSELDAQTAEAAEASQADDDADDEDVLGLATRRSRRAATATVKVYTDKVQSVNDLVEQALATFEGPVDMALIAETVVKTERKKPEARRNQAFEDAPHKALRDALGFLLRAGKARRTFADLSRDLDVLKRPLPPDRAMAAVDAEDEAAPEAAPPPKSDDDAPKPVDKKEREDEPRAKDDKKDDIEASEEPKAPAEATEKAPDEAPKDKATDEAPKEEPTKEKEPPSSSSSSSAKKSPLDLFDEERMSAARERCRAQRRRVEVALRALVLRALTAMPEKTTVQSSSSPGGEKLSLFAVDDEAEEDNLVGRRLEVSGVLGVYSGELEATMDDGSQREFANDEEVATAIARCGAPETYLPELARDPLKDQDIMVYWPKDRIFYIATVFAADVGDPGFLLDTGGRKRDASYAKRHLLVYHDDDSSEWIDLRKVRGVRFPKATKAFNDCRDAIATLERADDQRLFSSPVDDREPGLEDYRQVVTEPMDLGAAYERLLSRTHDGDDKRRRETSSYVDVGDDDGVADRIRQGTYRDLSLIYANAVRYHSQQGKYNSIAAIARRHRDILDASAIGPRPPNAKTAALSGKNGRSFPAAAAATQPPVRSSARTRTAGGYADADADANDDDDEDFDVEAAEKQAANGDLDDDDDDDEQDDDDDWRASAGGRTKKRRRGDGESYYARKAAARSIIDEIWTLDGLLASLPTKHRAEDFSHPPGFKLQRVPNYGRGGKLHSVTNTYRPESKEDLDQDDEDDDDDDAGNADLQQSVTAPMDTDKDDEAADDEAAASEGLVFGDRAALETQYFEAIHAETFPSPRRREEKAKKIVVVAAAKEEEEEPYLGAVVDGAWEIREPHARLALAHVLGTLVASGHVVEIAGDPLPTFVAAHLYEKSVPPAVEKKPPQKRQPAFFIDRPKSDYEIFREQRIALNKTFLEELGLNK